jgi:6-phosphogluconolactonase
MNIEVFADDQAAAQAAARLIAKEVRGAAGARGRFAMAVSGGRTPWIMLRCLGAEDVPWDSVDIFQVDERVAPEGDGDRNLTHLRESLLDVTPIQPERIHAMPVESMDLEAAARQYAAILPPTLDLVHLGLGPDGHTASLVPGDPVTQVTQSDVAVTGVYNGRRRMTLTYPAINRARRILWLATGAEKKEMLPRLYAGDVSIPAGRVSRDQSVIVADRAAAAAISG